MTWSMVTGVYRPQAAQFSLKARDYDDQHTHARTRVRTHSSFHLFLFILSLCDVGTTDPPDPLPTKDLPLSPSPPFAYGWQPGADGD